VLDLNLNGTAPAPVYALRAGAGYGKTRLWRECIAAPLLADPQRTAVLAVPRHKLGDEVVSDLARQGIEARVYRGREAADPDTPRRKMCREYDRTTEITAALGTVGRLACKSGTDQCEHYDICGYQKQTLQEPRVWVVPHQLLFLQRPDFISAPDALGIDESFWNASLRGFGPRQKIVWLSELTAVRDHALAEIRRRLGPRGHG
jgi:putative DNA primase/helicase